MKYIVGNLFKILFHFFFFQNWRSEKQTHQASIKVFYLPVKAVWNPLKTFGVPVFFPLRDTLTFLGEHSSRVSNKCLEISVSSVTQQCLTLCNPMDRSTPGLPVHHQLPSPPRPMSSESVMPSNHLILCPPLLLLLSIFSSIRIFSNESALRIRWPKY